MRRVGACGGGEAKRMRLVGEIGDKGPAMEVRRIKVGWSVKSALRGVEKVRRSEVGWSMKSAILGPAIEARRNEVG